MTELPELDYKSEEWYNEVVEELRGMIENFLDHKTEKVMETKWLIGETIREQNNPYGIQKQLAKDLHISERSVVYAVQFYDEFKAKDWDTAYTNIISKLTSNGCKPTWSGWLKFKKLGAINNCKHEIVEEPRYRCIKCGKVWKKKPNLPISQCE